MTKWSFSGPNDKYITEEDAFEHIDGLVARFKDSPEFQTYTQSQDGDPGGNVRLILELGWQYDGLLPSHCEFQDFQDTLLSLFPRKVSCPPEEAKLIVAELRAYLAFAQREFGYAPPKSV